MGHNRLLGLDALRGIAALVVFAHHVEMQYFASEVWKFGFLAVDLFFLLSGYVMARTYEPRMLSGMTSTSFLALRWRRLWLPLAVGCAIGFVSLSASGTPLGALVITFVLALAFLPSPVMGDRIFTLNEARWSLFFEVLANLIHCVLLARLNNRKLFVIWALSAVLFAIGAIQHGEIVAALSVYKLPFNLFRTMTSYTAGILLFRILSDSAPRNLWPWALAAFPALIILGTALPAMMFQLTFVIVACPLLVIALLRFDAPEPLCRAGSWLGALSYPLYAVHQPIIISTAMLALPATVSILAALSVAVAVTAWMARPKRHAAFNSIPAI